MPSERVQRRIDALLDEADAAISDGAWDSVAQKARAVLAIDPANEDATAFLQMAGANASPNGNGAAATAGEIARTVEAAAASLVQLTDDAAPENPESFAGGRYKVLRFLGEGGKKRVFLAHDALLDRDIAFSLIKTEGLDDVGRERIMREARAMGRLTHPNIVAIYDIGEHVAPDGSKQPYLVQELMGGGDVEGLLEHAAGPLPLQQALDIAIATARGLEFAHAQSVIHRDLKPGNVWLTADGAAKIGDLGLAVTIGQSRLTSHGMMVGTYGYMPPEQALGQEVTPQADLYSLGAMLYELVTGRPPFQGDTPTAVISQHLNTQPVAPSWYTQHCPPDLEALILRLLAKIPVDRPATATEVLEALQAVDPEARSASHSDSQANPLDRLARGAFVGRQTELDRLRAALDEAFAGHGSVAMVVGEPGIGKTRTCLELETYARMRGGRVIWGRAHEAAGAPPYRPWVQAGDSYSQQFGLDGVADRLDPGDGPELSRIFPGLRQQPNYVPPPDILDPDAAQFRLFEAYSHLLRAYVTDAPLLVVLDDLHWADKPSLLLLRHIAPELSRQRILILGNYRDTELSRTHPLSEVLASLNREGGFQRINLAGLSTADVAAYIRAVARIEPPRGLAERVHQETEGNPFFLAEVVNLMTEEGTLTSDSVSDIVIPEGVREALGRRLDRLSEEANALLQYAAVAGRQFAYDTLKAVSEHDDTTLLRLIEEGLGARVIEETQQAGRYQFTHALMQETLLEELSTTRKVRMHGQIAEVIESRYADRVDEQAARLARHFMESSTLNDSHAERAYRYSRIAAEQAEAQAAWDEAARLWGQAASVAETTALPGLDQGEIHYRYGRSLVRSHAYRDGWREQMRALDVFRERRDGTSFAQTVLELPTVAPPARVQSLREEALELLQPREAPVLEADLLVGLMSPGGPGRLVDDRLQDSPRYRRFVEIADGSSDPSLLIRRRLVDAWIAFSMGLRTRYQELLREIMSLEDEHGALPGLGPRLGLAFSLLDDGLIEEAESSLAEGRKRARRQGDWNSYNTSLQLQSSLRIAAGRWDEAEGFGAQREGEFWYADLPLASMEAMRGDLSRAVETLPHEDAPGIDVPAARWLYLCVAHAVYSLAGAGDRARSLLAELEEGALPMGRTEIGLLLTALPQAPDLAPMMSNASAELKRHIYSHLIAHPFNGWRFGGGGSHDRVRGSFALSLDLLDDAGQWFDASLELTSGAGLDIETGRCHQGLAEVAERRGDLDAAREHLDAAGELFARHGAKLYLDQVLAKKEILKA